MTTRTEEFQTLLEAIEDDPNMTQLATLPCMCGVEMGYHLMDASDGSTESDCPLAKALVQEAQALLQMTNTTTNTLTSMTFAPNSTASTAATTDVIYVMPETRTAANTYTIRILKPNERLTSGTTTTDVHSD